MDRLKKDRATSLLAAFLASLCHIIRTFLKDVDQLDAKGLFVSHLYLERILG